MSDVPMTARLDAAHLYPATMNTYGDRGNVAALTRRAAARGIEIRWHALELDDGPPARCDLVFMGGGQDRVQQTVARDLQRRRDWLEALAGGGGVVFAVCAGLQLLGHRYVAADGSELRGLGLLDLETVAAKPGEWRLIGNVVVDVDLPGGSHLVAGFENHGGRTWLGDVAPFGRVRHGSGNNGVDGGEGARRGTVLATYLHGPVLPKNAWLTDHLLGLASAHAGGPAELGPLEQRREDAAQAEAVRVAECDARSRKGAPRRRRERPPTAAPR